jgi:hypothetical protein
MINRDIYNADRLTTILSFDLKNDTVTISYAFQVNNFFSILIENSAFRPEPRFDTPNSPDLLLGYLDNP